MPKAKSIAGDPRVVAHPSFREIPAPQFELQTEKGKAEYDQLARRLFDSGRFTMEAHRKLSAYASLFDVIQVYLRDGKMLKAATYTQLDRARSALRIDEIDQPIASAEDAPVSIFARNGFANRR